VNLLNKKIRKNDQIHFVCENGTWYLGKNKNEFQIYNVPLDEETFIQIIKDQLKD
jgi:hypothetical protein